MGTLVATTKSAGSSSSTSATPKVVPTCRYLRPCCICSGVGGLDPQAGTPRCWKFATNSRRWRPTPPPLSGQPQPLPADSTNRSAWAHQLLEVLRSRQSAVQLIGGSMASCTSQQLVHIKPSVDRSPAALAADSVSIAGRLMPQINHLLTEGRSAMAAVMAH